ncbi:SUF system NifU family Fe-S cluster assembly protein [bacterium]|nr:SUF system NifU family Fe-S cluster assembly protein [bacterium]
MSRLEALYQQLILDHNKNPQNFKKVASYSHYSHGRNPLCGDDYEVMIRVENNRIEDIGFSGSGCAISKSSGSLMTAALKGKTVEESVRLKDSFIQLLLEDVISPDEVKNLGKLAVFEGVKKFPARVKCAALVWRALEDALAGQKGAVSTE